MKTRSQRKSKESENVDSTTENIIELECAICLQQCVHPVQLNCQHIFCYLCVKGVQKKQCPICRSDISQESIYKKKIVKGFTTNPSLMRKAGASNYINYIKKKIYLQKIKNFKDCLKRQKNFKIK